MVDKLFMTGGVQELKGSGSVRIKKKDTGRQANGEEQANWSCTLYVALSDG